MTTVSDLPLYVFSDGATLTRSIHAYLLVMQKAAMQHHRYSHSASYLRDHAPFAGQIYAAPGFTHHCRPEDLQALLEWMVTNSERRFATWLSEMKAEGATESYLHHFSGPDRVGRWMALGSTSRQYAIYSGHLVDQDQEFHRLGAKLAKLALKDQRAEADRCLRGLGL